MKTTFTLSPDLTASLTDNGYLLTVRSEMLDDYDAYKLTDGDWELTYDSLSNRMDEANDIWTRQDFVAWAEQVKRCASIDANE